MQFLGVSPTELIVIVIILFLVLGPQDLVKLGSTVGRGLRNVRQSGAWQSFQEARQQLRNLPETLARQAGIDEIKEVQQELKEELQEQRAELEDLDKQFAAWTRSPEPLSQKKKQPPTEANPQPHKRSGKER